jgi:hypothetical protein
VTGPSPPPDPESARRAALWCARLADGLADIGRRVGRLSQHIAGDWPDDRGRELAERSQLLHRELARHAVAAAELGEAYAHRPVDPSPLPAITGLPAGRGHQGMRLGGTQASRADDERGMRIAELPAPDAPAS